MSLLAVSIFISSSGRGSGGDGGGESLKKEMSIEVRILYRNITKMIISTL